MVQRLQRHIRAIITVFRDPVFIKQSIWVALLGLAMLAVILLNIDFLNTHYPNPPQPPDRILDMIEQDLDFLPIGEALSQIQVTVMVLIVFSAEARLRKLPKLFFLLAVMYIIRSFAFTLTPLAQITPPGQYYAETHLIAQKFYHGMFFSGHSASALMQAFFFWDERIRGVRITWFVLPLALGQVIAMLLGHQHYSIDIFGAAFVTYFMLTFNFMWFVPKPLLNVRWMPWYAGLRQECHEAGASV